MPAPIEIHGLRVERSARYFTQGDPSTARIAWFVLHGYGQSAERFLGEFEELAAPDRLFVAPEGLSRFYLRGASGRIGASWMTKEDRAAEVRDYVAYLDALRRTLELAPEVEVGMLGFSQGAATATRWAVLGETPPAHLMLCSGGLAPDLEPERMATALSETEVTLVIGDADPQVDPEVVAREAARLEAIGIRPHTHVFEGAHRLNTTQLAALLAR